MKLKDKVARVMMNMGLASAFISLNAWGYDAFTFPKDQEERIVHHEALQERAPYYALGMIGGAVLMGLSPVVARKPVEIFPYIRRKK
jgi:hypothetical protein